MEQTDVGDLVSRDSIPKSQVEFLPKADTADELKARLEKIFRWIDNEKIEWEKLGRVQNMSIFSDITDGETGLIENLTNIADAYILQKYDGGDFRNSREAARSLLEGDEECILRVDGEKPHAHGSNGPSLTFADAAHGQSKEDFNTFVDPVNTGTSKRDKPFLQGCRGIGGMVALSNAQNGFKFIASASSENPENWTWTIIRQDDDYDYEYLTIGGEFPTFVGEFDCGEGIGKKSQGTVVKLYSYELETTPRNIENSSAFMRRLTHKMSNPIVPIEIVETRYENSSRVYTGLDGQIEKKSELFYDPIKGRTNIDGLGEVEIKTYVAKSQDVREEMENEGVVESASVRDIFTSNDERVLISLNGQTHATYTEGQVSSRTGLECASENLISVVEILDNPGSIQEGVFNAARDDFSDRSVKKETERSVFSFLRENERLAEINEDLEGYKITSSQVPENMDIQTERIRCDFNDRPKCQLKFDGTTDYVKSDDIYVAGNSYSSILHAEMDKETELTLALVPKDIDIYPKRTDKVTIIGDFADNPTICTVEIQYIDGNTETQDDSTIDTRNDNYENDLEDTSLVQMHNRDKMHPIHERTLRRLEDYAVSSVAKKMIRRYSFGNILSNLSTIIEESRPHIKGLVSERGDDIRQASNSHIGNLNEILVYYALVENCEREGYVIRHEPDLDDIDGIESGDFVEPDMDIVIHEDGSDSSPIYILSLKTTLRERIGQSALWKTWLDISHNSCGNSTCPTNDFEYNLFEENSRDRIYYGYVTTEEATSKLLDVFDFGYVPSQHVDKSLGQEPLRRLPTIIG